MSDKPNNDNIEAANIDDMVDKKIVIKNLHCSIMNPQILETGLEPVHIFSNNGGRIGSDQNNEWVLTDQSNNIYAVHCRITIEDYNFCLTSLSGNTYVNDSDLALVQNKPAMLTTNDVVTIGTYKIRIQIMDSDETLDSPRYQRRDLSAFFPGDMDSAQLVPGNDTYSHGEVLNKTDPLLALSNSYRSEENSLLQRDKHDQSLWNKQGSAHTDYQYNLGAAITNSPSRSQNIPTGLDASLSELENISTYPSYDAAAYSDHLATGPLLRGLGVGLSHSDHSGEMQYVAQEIGASLKESISGLLKLHKQVNKSRYGLMNKNFQPIEDNPLRLGLSYEETVKLMYDSEVSPVHLSPPAAINESLDMIYNHQEAMHEAISEALTQVLHAFSPEALTRRFNYYRLARNVPETDRETWAWKMYKSYYSELVSNRQAGFQKLFWEIFDQVYDKKMRDLQNQVSVDNFNLNK